MCEMKKILIFFKGKKGIYYQQKSVFPSTRCTKEKTTKWTKVFTDKSCTKNKTRKK